MLLLRCLVLLALAAALAKPSVASAVFGAWLTISGISLSAILVSLLLLAAMISMRPISRLLVGILGAILLCHLIAGAWLTVNTLARGEEIEIGSRESAVAAALIFDTSPRMSYQQENKNRLEAAKELGDWLLGELPADSQVAVLDASPEVGFFSVDVAAARKRMKTLDHQFDVVPITTRIVTALELLKRSELEGREIYLFTDLSRVSWSGGDSRRVASLLEENPRVSVYLIDLGVEQPANLQLGDLQLKAEAITLNGKLEIAGELMSDGLTGSRRVQLFVEKPDPRRPVRRDGKTLLPAEFWKRETTVEVSDQQRVPFRFELSGLPEGAHHGWIEFLGADGLAFDNRRHFTVEVRGQWKTLIVSPPEVSPVNVTELLAPYAFRQSGQAMFECKQIEPADLSAERLDEYSAVYLLDPNPLSEATWSLLKEYVNQGGGLFVALGHNAQTAGSPDESFNSTEAQSVLPGELTTIWEDRRGELFISPQDYSHEIMAPFRQSRTSTPWADFGVRRHWGIRANPTQDATQIRVVTRFSNQMPALVERRVGAGRVLLLTTPFTDPLQLDERYAWNNFSSNECWPVALLVWQGSQYLVQVKQKRLNYRVGESVVMENDPDKFPSRYTLFRPLPEEEPRTLRADEELLRFRFTSQPGSYRLKGEKEGVVQRGFSVNADSSTSDLSRIDETALNDILGIDRYQLARTREEIQREQGVMRKGQEFYPLLVIGMIVLLSLEHLLANRFYSRRHAAGTVSISRLRGAFGK